MVRRTQPTRWGPPRIRGQRLHAGIALISVLWVLVLLSTLALGLSATVRTELSLAANSIGMSKARYAAEGGVQIGAQNLLLPRAERWPADGSIREVAIDGIRLKIATFDESGKIDLNYADPELLARLLILADVDQNRAIALADAILDWRDGDDLRRLQGAEASDYRAAGLPYEPRDGPFESVSELQLVLGMEPDIFDRIRQALTVYSGSSGVNVELASPQVAEAIAGFEQMRPNTVDRVFTLHVEAESPDGMRAQLSVTLQPVPGRPTRPFDVFAWELPRVRLFSPGTDAITAGLADGAMR